MAAYWPFTQADKEKHNIRETTPFGPQPDGSFHGGNDYAPADHATDINLIASQGGMLSRGTDGNGGLWQYIKGIDGRGYLNVHLSKFLRSDGKVNAGDVIGIMGKTGHATGIHDHFVVRANFNDESSAVDADKQGLLYFGGLNFMATLHLAASFVTKAPLSLYPQPDQQNAYPGISIPTGTKFDEVVITNASGKDYFGNSTWVQVSYGGKVGWIPEYYVTYLKTDCSVVEAQLTVANKKIADASAILK